mgnify:CR=1 FL=1
MGAHPSVKNAACKKKRLIDADKLLNCSQRCASDHRLLNMKSTIPRTVIPIRLGSSLCYFIPSRNGALLIDAGNAGKVDHLNSVLLAHEYELQDIKLIVLTHTHHDHVGSLAEIKLRTGAKVMVHAAEAGFLQKGHTPLPNGTTPWTKLAVGAGRLANFGKYEAVTPDIVVNGKTDLREFGVNGKVLPTPGHTAGSISVILNGRAFVGDTLFGFRSENVFPPFLSNLDELKKSWNILLNTPCRTFYPGHGRPISRPRFERAFSQLMNGQSLETLS